MKKFMSLLLALSMTLALCTAMSVSVSAEVIKVEAENASSKKISLESDIVQYYNGDTPVYLDHSNRKIDETLGYEIVTSSFPGASGEVINFACLDEYTYTITDVVAGKYALSVSAACHDRQPPFIIKVNGSNNLSYTMSSDATLSEKAFGTLDLIDGTNTIFFTIEHPRNYNVAFDYFTLTPVSDIPETTPDPEATPTPTPEATAPVVGDTFRIEGEDFTSYYHSTAHGKPEEGTTYTEWVGDVMTGWNPNNTASVKVLLIREHNSSASYVVDVTTAGKYKVTLNTRIQGSRVGKIRPVVYVDGEMQISHDSYGTTPEVNGLTGNASDGDIYETGSFYDNEIGYIYLKEGKNTITIGLLSNAGYYNYSRNFVLDYADFERQKISTTEETIIPAWEYNTTKSVDDATNNVNNLPNAFEYSSNVRNVTARIGDKLVYSFGADAGVYEVYAKYLYAPTNTGLLPQFKTTIDTQSNTVTAPLTAENWSQDNYEDVLLGRFTVATGLVDMEIAPVQEAAVLREIRIVPVKVGISINSTTLYSNAADDMGEGKFTISDGTQIFYTVEAEAGNSGDKVNVFLATYTPGGALDAVTMATLDSTDKALGDSLQTTIDLVASDKVDTAKAFVFDNTTQKPLLDTAAINK